MSFSSESTIRPQNPTTLTRIAALTGSRRPHSDECSPSRWVTQETRSSGRLNHSAFPSIPTLPPWLRTRRLET